MRQFLKRSLNQFMNLLITPVVLGYRIGLACGSPERALAGWSQLLSLIPGTTGEWLRRAFYQRTLAHCGPDVCLSFGAILSHPGASLGRSVYVGPFSLLGNVTIGDDVLIGSHVSVMNGTRQHGIERLDIPMREQPGVYEPVSIGRDSWIGERAVVAADVGRHCIIGAGAVVLKPIPDYAVAVGIPARVIRYRNEPALSDEAGTPPPSRELAHSAN